MGLTIGLTTVLNEQTVHSTRLSNRLYNWFDSRLYTPYSWLSNRFDNRLYRVYIHLTGCQTGLTTGLTTRCKRGLSDRHKVRFSFGDRIGVGFSDVE